LEALALNYQGYLDRQQGRYRGATQHYQASAMLQRRLGMAGLASVLINLSYALALVGECHHGRLVTEEAGRWARRLGQEYMLALALNARALVEEYDRHHKAALAYSDQALGIARGLLAPRLRGLIYLTRARAHRHLMEDQVWQGMAGAAEFDEAIKDANQAVNLLKNNPPDRVVALIERGCLYREVARWHYRHDDQVEAVQAVRRSRRDLERTLTLAGIMDLAEQQALAWTHLGWLSYYTGQTEEAQQALEQAVACIPADYAFGQREQMPAMTREERKGEARLPFWNTLGQVEMIKAQIALDQALVSKEAGLEQAVRHISLALAYLAQAGDGHFDLNRTEERLHQRLLEDRLYIGLLHEHAGRVAAKLGLPQPSRFQEFLNRMFGPAELWA
jgi:tetratricopeptide (TPR) repeat protein